MPVPLKQASFIGGEIDPALHARTDLERYGQALATCRNFIVRPTGGVVNRPGTRFLQETEGSVAVRLIPFVFSQAPGQSYVLEFSPLKVRFYAMDSTGIAGIVLSAGVPYEVATPYGASDLTGLRYAQAGDVLTLVHRGHAPKELRRLGHTSWTLTDLAFTRTLAPPTAVSVTQPGVPAVDATHPTRSWFYVICAIAKLANGEPGDSSLPSTPEGANLQRYGDRPDVLVTWTAPAGSVYGYDVFVGRDGSYGFIGRTIGAGATSFRDNALAPVLNDTPPTGRTPFVGAGDFPGLVAFFEQRLVLAASENDPTTVWTSRTGALRNFDVSRPAKDDDAITLALASLQVDAIRSLVPMRSLLALTSSSEWSVGGSEGRPITPTALEARPHSFEGSEDIHALVIGSVAMFVPRGGGVQSIAFDWQSDGYASKDLSILASHLFQGRSVVSWAYAGKPFKCLWVVLDDGAALALTYVREHEVWAWHQHATDGAAEEVCVIPEGAEDGVYLVVRRTVQGAERRYVERMARRLVPDPRDGCFLDSALTYDGRNSDPARVLALTGGAWVSGSEVTCSAGVPVFSAMDVGAKVRLTHAAGVLNALVIAYDNPNVVTVRVEADVPAELQGITTAAWSIARKTVSGLSHLEGATVRACADGNAHPAMTVASGTVSLQHHADVIHVGLSYQSRLVSLPARAERTSQKIVSHVAVDLLDSRGVQVGSVPSYGASERLEAQRSRTVEDGWSAGALSTGLQDIPVSSGYDTPGGWVLVQDEPLPACVLSVIPKLEASRVA